MKSKTFEGIIAPFLIASVVLSGCIYFSTPPPVPLEPDEYSYLLAADTFAHGRLANPQHPHWKFFEAPQVLQRPTYTSKYHPLQGLVLALGKILFGSEISGVWLSMVVAAIAIYWALLSVFPWNWALFGALFSTCQADVLFWWGATFWGGAVALIGGALVTGAALRLRTAFIISPDDNQYVTENSRLKKTKLIISSLLGGLGASILIGSRPYEGMVVIVLSLAYITYGIFKNRSLTIRQFAYRIIIPSLLGASPIILFVLSFNHATTGSALIPPYILHTLTYMPAPPLIIMPSIETPKYNHESLKAFFLFVEKKPFEFCHSVMGGIRADTSEQHNAEKLAM